MNLIATLLLLVSWLEIGGLAQMYLTIGTGDNFALLRASGITNVSTHTFVGDHNITSRLSYSLCIALS